MGPIDSRLNIQRVLITGGAGFIGSHTTDYFLENGLQVIVYDDLSTGKLANLNVFHPNFKFVQGDILNYSALKNEIQKCDAVLHLAALSSVPSSIEDPIQSLKINTLGFLHVLQALREINKPVRLVYASSAAVYGGTTDLPCDDNKIPEGVMSPYALEKANDERYADLYERLFDIKSLGLRYFNVYGPRQDPRSPYSGVISKFIDLYQKNELIQIFGDGQQSRDFIHVKDIARANYLAIQHRETGRLNIATGVPETLNNLIHYLEELGKKTAQIKYVSARAGDIPRSFAAIEKAKKCINFNYQISLNEGLGSLLLDKTAK